MKRKFALFIVFILFVSAISIPVSTGYTMEEVTKFSDANASKTFTFPSNGGTDQSSSFSIPKKAVVTDASFNVSMVYNQASYPSDPMIDVGADGDTEWAFFGKGYGEYGRQSMFSDGEDNAARLFDGNVSYRDDINLLLPKNATVTSASMDLESYDIYNATIDGSLEWSWSRPFYGTGYNAMRFQTLYQKAEIDFEGNISKIYYKSRTTSNNNQFKYFTVKLCNTTTTILSSTFANNYGGNQPTTVFSQNITLNVINGQWFEIDVADDFYYNGKDNLLIELTWNGDNGRTIYTELDNSARCVYSSSSTATSGGWTNYKHDIIFGFECGRAANITVDIGNNGTLEYNRPGEFVGTENIINITEQLNNLTNDLPVAFTDGYGNQFVDIPVNITNDEEGLTFLRDMDIKYNLTSKAFLNPHNDNLINELNEFIPDIGEGNVIIPNRITTSSGGKVWIGDISIDYYVPDLTNDVLYISNGHGPQNICYADYENYTFISRVTNKAGAGDVKNVTLTLDAGTGGEQIELCWNQSTGIFWELRDPKDLVTIDVSNCSSYRILPDRWGVNFTVRFNWAYPDQSLQRCALKITNSTDSFDFDYFDDVYRVETDLELIGTLDVVSQDEGVLIEDGINNWVHASETITWSDLTAVYEDTTNIYPADKNFNITIIDNDDGKWVNSSSSGNKFVITTVSDPVSDYFDIHYINITDIPGVGRDVSDWTFMVKTDNDGPLVPPNLLVRADSTGDTETNYDDDTEVYITWTPGSDAGGSGILEYAMGYENNKPTTIKESGCKGTGEEGVSTFYVRARDRVGNWGATGSASIFIDLTNLNFAEPIPPPEIWHTSKTVECGITIKDLSGSGVMASSIQYRFVDKGYIGSGSWNSYQTQSNEEIIVCGQDITFKNDGVEKKVQWRAKDLAGNGYIESNIFNLKIDSTPVTFESFGFNLNVWHNTVTPEIKFYINDTNPNGDESSGVDVGNIFYSYSTVGDLNYVDWEPSYPSGSGNSVICTINPTLEEGNQNHIRFKAFDLAGNEIISEPYRVKIDISKPIFSEPVPSPTTWCNRTHLQCNITISDPYSKLDVQSVKYSISINGTDHYSNWRAVNIKYLEKYYHKNITISCNETFAEGVKNYIRWRVMDTAGNMIISDDYHILIDISICVLQNPTPAENTWLNEVVMDCGILISDSTGSGIDLDSIEYALSVDGPNNIKSWKRDGIEKEELTNIEDDDEWPYPNSNGGPTLVFAYVTVRIFNEGKENYIYWRVNDMANTGQVKGGPYRVLIDQSPLNFSNPRPDPNFMQAELEIPCQITIHDLGGSGVDPESVEFRYLTGEMEDFTEWNSTCITYNKKTNGYDFLVYIIFQPGDSNYVQWRGKDHAGNGPFESMSYSIYINSPPMIKIKSPTTTGIYYEQEDIIFDARNSFDPDFGDTLSFFWRSNKTGILGHKDSFKARLLPGTHRITLWVSDDHYHNVSQDIEITVMWLDLDGDGIPDINDPDIDGDDHLNDEDAFPFDRTEWLDTDFDTIGNNKDPDDDNDEYPDDEDEFPLDKDRWQKEASESSYLLLIIMLVVFIIIIILGVFGYTKYKAKHKKKAVEGEAGAVADGEETDIGDSAAPTTTSTQPQPAPPMPVPAPVQPASPSPYQAPMTPMGSGQYGPSPPYPQSMFIPSQPFTMAPMPYLPPPGFTGMGGGMDMGMSFPPSPSQPMQTQPMQTPTYIQSLPQLPPAQINNTKKRNDPK